MWAGIKYIFRHWGILLVLGILIAGTWYFLWLHRMPFTQNAFVVANVRPVSALVEGYITDIYVKNNQAVRKGDPLFTVFKRPYELKIEGLTNALAAEQFRQKGIGFQISSAEAVVKANTEATTNAKYLSDQAQKLYGEQATSQKYAEEQLQNYRVAQSKLMSAQHDLDAVRQQYFQSNATQAQLRSQLDYAKLELELSTVRALADGTIANMFVSPGGYVKPGDVQFAFIETSTWWVQANFQETELSQLRPGQKAVIWFWQYPGREFHGVVEATGWGVDRKITSNVGGMPVVQKENEWFLLPQRFPVQIRITDPDPACELHPGASAFVQIQVQADPLRQFLWQMFRR